MLVEGITWEVGVSLEDVYDDGPPGDDVSLLSFFFEENERADNISTETIIMLACGMRRMDADFLRYQSPLRLVAT